MKLVRKYSPIVLAAALMISYITPWDYIQRETIDWTGRGLQAVFTVFF
ncbi:hypothetical protein [Oceanobacillus halotolerans]|nr:hypothetical protein [Oceanobacillus halotolerans]